MENYDLWEKVVIASLKLKNTLGFIDGLITKPTETQGECSDEAKAWEMVNSMVMPQIMNVIDPRIHTCVAYVDTTQHLWENIKKRYDVPNIPRVHKLKAEIASYKQNK